MVEQDAIVMRAYQMRSLYSGREMRYGPLYTAFPFGISSHGVIRPNTVVHLRAVLTRDF